MTKPQGRPSADDGPVAVGPSLRHEVLEAVNGIGMDEVAAPVTGARVRSALDELGVRWVPGRRLGVVRAGFAFDGIGDDVARGFSVLIGEDVAPDDESAPGRLSAPAHHLWVAGWFDFAYGADQLPRLLVLANKWNRNWRYPTAAVRVEPPEDGLPQRCFIDVEQHLPVRGGLSPAALRSVLGTAVGGSVEALRRLSMAAYRGDMELS